MLPGIPGSAEGVRGGGVTYDGAVSAGRALLAGGSGGASGAGLARAASGAGFTTGSFATFLPAGAGGAGEADVPLGGGEAMPSGRDPPSCQLKGSQGCPSANWDRAATQSPMDGCPAPPSCIPPHQQPPSSTPQPPPLARPGVLTEGPGGPTLPAAPGKPVAPWKGELESAGAGSGHRLPWPWSGCRGRSPGWGPPRGPPGQVARRKASTEGGAGAGLGGDKGSPPPIYPLLHPRSRGTQPPRVVPLGWFWGCRAGSATAPLCPTALGGQSETQWG